MKLNSVFKKSLMLLIFLLIAQLAAVPAFAASDKTNIEIKVDAGFDGIARYNSKTPFRISLYNRGSAFKGEVQAVITLEGYNTSQVYAMPCSLATGARKELVMDIPILTAKKNFEIRLVRGNKTVKTIEYKFKKLLSPQTPVVGVISDDKGVSGGFTGILMPRIYQSSGQGVAVTSPSGYSVNGLPANYQAAEVVELSETSVPDTLDGFGQFDALLISNYDTSLLSSEQYEALGKWIENGGILITATGPSWKKTYGGMPYSMKPFEVSSATFDISAKFLEMITGIDPPAGYTNIADINSKEGKTLYNREGHTLAIALPKGNGAQVILAFDPGLDPVAEWSGVKKMWQMMINDIYNTTAAGKASQKLQSQSMVDTNYSYLASNVPENRTPPFVMLLFIIGAYILIAGPVIYLFLKWRDKRDWNWLVIPAAALLFLGAIYVAGFKTRYTAAVLNTVSLVDLDFEKGKENVNSYMGIYNNQKSNMKVAYNKELGLLLSPGNDMGMFITSSYKPAFNINSETNRMVCKYTFANPPTWEFFNTMLWEPKLMYLMKSGKLEGKLFNFTTIKDNHFKAEIKNTTGLVFKEAFFIIGNNYIYAGTIKPNELKTFDIDLNSSSVTRGLTDYLDAWYGHPYYGGSVKNLPKDWKEKNRKRNILESILRNKILADRANATIKFYALNYDDFHYNIKVNGKDPEVYSTNLFSAQTGLMPGKGERVTIPSGIIVPALIQKNNAFYDDPASGSVRVQSDGDVNFRFAFPENVKVDKMRIKWSTILPSYIKYQQVPKGAPKQVITKNTYTFFIYNATTRKWEQTGTEKILTGSLSDYLDGAGQIEVKAQAVVNKQTPSQELLNVPDIEISGVIE